MQTNTEPSQRRAALFRYMDALATREIMRDFGSRARELLHASQILEDLERAQQPVFLTSYDWETVGDAWLLSEDQSILDTTEGICNSVFTLNDLMDCIDLFCPLDENGDPVMIGPDGEDRETRAMVCYFIAAMIEHGDD